MKRLSTVGGTAWVMGFALMIGACGANEDAEPSTEGAASAPPAAEAVAPGDQEFLREMTNHHHGMVTMAHEAMEKTGSSVQEEATAIDQKQDEEIEQMLAILLKDFSDPHTPTIDPATQAMADGLSSKSGEDYDRTFRMHVIEHHEQGIAMIDRFLPRLTRPDVREMAERMKADQQKEIQDMRAEIQQ